MKIHLFGDSHSGNLGTFRTEPEIWSSRQGEGLETVADDVGLVEMWKATAASEAEASERVNAEVVVLRKALEAIKDMVIGALGNQVMTEATSCTCPCHQGVAIMHIRPCCEPTKSVDVAQADILRMREKMMEVHYLTDRNLRQNASTVRTWAKEAAKMLEILATRTPPGESGLREALAALIPNNVALNNPAWSDDTVIPVDVTLGELRRASEAMERASPEQRTLLADRLLNGVSVGFNAGWSINDDLEYESDFEKAKAEIFPGCLSYQPDRPTSG